MSFLSRNLMPFILLCFGTYCLFSGHKGNDAFMEGAGNGMRTCLSLFPTLLLLTLATRMLRTSGLIDDLSRYLAPYAGKIGIPSEMMPLILMRPFSGSGSTTLLKDLYETAGTDSFSGLAASVLASSSDTLFYIVTVYMGAAGVKKTRYTIPLCILLAVTSVILSVLITGLCFRSRQLSLM